MFVLKATVAPWYMLVGTVAGQLMVNFGDGMTTVKAEHEDFTTSNVAHPEV